jgi:mannose-6-phosphate isomerase-like protein (cupin superfamily)
VALWPRGAGWRDIGPDYAAALALAGSGLAFHVVADGRVDRPGDPRRLRQALAAGATVFFPQIHEVLPRLARLMVALRATLLGHRPEECSFLFLVEGRGRAGMGLHHDGEVDGFWLQLEGRRTVTVGPPVPPGTPEEIPAASPGARGWRTLELTPGTLFYLPPRTPHAVVCHRRSLAVSLTWQPSAGRAVRRRALPAWDVASGCVAVLPRQHRGRLWTQVPVVGGPSDPRGRRVSLLTPDGQVWLPARARRLVQRLATMPNFPRRALPVTWADTLLEHGVVASQDLPRLIVPDDPAALDGHSF